MKETGKIIEITGEEMLVEIENGENCANCGLCSSITGHAKKVISHKTLDNAVVGEYVIIEIPDDAVLKSSIIIFLLPVIGIFTGILSAYLLKDLIKIEFNLLLASLILMFIAVSFILIRIIDKRSKIKDSLIIKRVNE